jgi:hypothetical protein
MSVDETGSGSPPAAAAEAWSVTTDFLARTLPVGG